MAKYTQSQLRSLNRSERQQMSAAETPQYQTQQTSQPTKTEGEKELERQIESKKQEIQKAIKQAEYYENRGDYESQGFKNIANNIQRLRSDLNILETSKTSYEAASKLDYAKRIRAFSAAAESEGKTGGYKKEETQSKTQTNVGKEQIFEKDGSYYYVLGGNTQDSKKIESAGYKSVSEPQIKSMIDAGSYIQERKVSEFTPQGELRPVEVSEIVVKDPFGNVRPATKQEQDYYLSEQKARRFEQVALRPKKLSIKESITEQLYVKPVGEKIRRALPYGLEPTYQKSLFFTETGEQVQPKTIVGGVNKLFSKASDVITEKSIKLGIVPKSVAKSTVYVGDLPGQSVLAAGFSPFFASGAATKQKLLQKQLSKNKFDELAGQLGEIEKKLLNQKTRKEQLKILDDIAGKLKTSEAKENFKRWVKTLEERQILKQDVYFIGKSQEVVQPKKNILTSQRFDELVLDQPVPKMKGASAYQLDVKQENVLGLKSSQAQKQIQKQLEKQSQGQNQLFDFKQVEKQTQKESQTQKQSQKQLQLFKFAESQLSKTSQIQKQIQQLAFNQPELFKQLTKTKRSQLLKQIPKKPQRGKPRIKTPPKPSGSFGFPDLDSSKNKFSRKKKALIQLFSRRFGKEVPLGFAKSKEQAEGILRKYIFGGLARSGKATKGGEVLDINLGAGFREAKSPALRGFKVQKNPLQFGSEVSEIQMFRKRSKKSGKKKGGNLFFK